MPLGIDWKPTSPAGGPDQVVLGRMTLRAIVASAAVSARNGVNVTFSVPVWVVALLTVTWVFELTLLTVVLAATWAPVTLKPIPTYVVADTRLSIVVLVCSFALITYPMGRVATRKKLATPLLPTTVR